MTDIEILDLTPERWSDFERLMGPRGGAGGCWCALWRLPAKAWEAGKGDDNKALMHAVVAAGGAPGLLAYDGAEPVGWISVAPRRDFPRLANARVLKPVDGAEVWSISCFLIKNTHRKQGLSTALLNAACDFVQRRGGRIVEGYPIDTTGKPAYPAVYAWTGLLATFQAAGFEEVARRSATRPIMRRAVGSRGSAFGAVF